MLETKTLQFEVVQEKDPSGSDAIWNKYTIKVRGFLARNVPTLQTPKIETDTSAFLKEIKEKLQTPRRPMAYTVGGTTMVSLGDVRDTTLIMDAKYGPDPLPASVYQVSSGTYAVDCGVVVRLADCGNCTPSSNPVVSLRWSQTESFDENWNSHLITSGLLIIRTDLLQGADNFRRLATPPMLQDYVRKSSEYTLSPDGTNLTFRFDDMEVDRLPPAPATKANGSMTVTCKNGGIRVGTVRVALEAPKGVSRKELMIRALAIAYAKITPEFTSIDNYKSSNQIVKPVISSTLMEDLFEPRVEVTLSAILSPLVNEGSYLQPNGTLKTASSPVAFPSVGIAPHAIRSDRKGISPPDRKRLKALLSAAFGDPCCS